VATIFYGSCGEGRGHATRVRAVVERLRARHDVVVFAFGDALALLARAYRGTGVRVERIPGVRFGYGGDGRVSLARTAAAATRYLVLLQPLVARLVRLIASEKPDLVVTDFEPALPRAARRCGLPVVSIDHQHFLTTEDLGILPRWLRLHAWAMGGVVSAYVSDASETVVSSFHHLPLRTGVSNVTQVGPLLRPQIRSAETTNGGHLVAYFRRSVPERALGAIAGLGLPTRVYGLGALPARRGLVFLEVDESAFAADLAACRALVTTAGNQIIGEAIFLGKPVFAVPEPGNFEQAINARLLGVSGCGAWAHPHAVRSADLERFLGGSARFQANIRRRRRDGTAAAVAAIERRVSGAIRHGIPFSPGAVALDVGLTPAVAGRR